MKNKYEFYEIVKVISKKGKLKKIYGIEAPIRGMSEEDGRWGYAIALPNATWSVEEEDIKSTGKFADPNDYKPVDTVHVRVLSDGSGEIIKDD